MTPGSIYKNRRRHPDRVFFITEVKRVKVGTKKMQRIYGVQVVQDGGPDDTASYLNDSFHREFPFLMFAP